MIVTRLVYPKNCPAVLTRMLLDQKQKESSRVRRGRLLAEEGWPLRSAFRLRFEPERSNDQIGFSVVAPAISGSVSRD